MELTDEHLLLAWADRGDESAFDALAGRYGGFVFGSAMRRVGDGGLAQEIAQDVLIVMARQARKLSAHVSLAAWLHRTTMIISLDRVRHRVRRERKLAQFAAMKLDSSSLDPWKEVAPHLDEALDRLRSADRNVLMLHFAERFTFPEIAARIGSSSDAVRMQTTRALQTIARMLQRRGATFSVAALSAGLGSAFAQAAPVGLAFTATMAAGAAKVSPSLLVAHAFHGMKYSKIGTAILSLLLAAIAVLQRAEIAKADERIASLRRGSPTAEAMTPRPGISKSVNASAFPAQGSNAGLNLAKMSRTALDNDLLEMHRLQMSLARLDENNLGGLLETVLQSDLLLEPKEALLGTLLDEMGTRSPELRLRWSLVVMAQARESFLAKLMEEGQKMLRLWAERDPEAATKWTLANGAEWDRIRIQDREDRATLKWRTDSLSFQLAAGLLASDPPRAFALMEKLPPILAAGVVKERNNLARPQLLALADWAAHDDDLERKRRVLRATANRLYRQSEGKEGWLEVGTMLSSLPLTDQDRAWVAVRVLQDDRSGIDSKTDPDGMGKATTWLATFLPSNVLPYAQGALAHIYQPATALQNLGEELDAEPNDEMIAGYVESPDMKWHREILGAPGHHGDTAFRLATRIEEPERRKALLALAWEDLRQESRQDAVKILEIPELTAEDRAALEAQFAKQLEQKQ